MSEMIRDEVFEEALQKAKEKLEKRYLEWEETTRKEFLEREKHYAKKKTISEMARQQENEIRERKRLFKLKLSEELAKKYPDQKKISNAAYNLTYAQMKSTWNKRKKQEGK